ncbi:hypothetical protein B0T25DRAFT_308796 [Lasiosphaeria hispida]|uniref:Secreted protein n=1 Tax=Lasiosphaeria hispida TaxID=260671 RepID=A0AAJ0H8M6_9PEZI|nr:hypothetical protein B0T25DRAFT_308796 [Lasiosphaeria hispida]
MGHTFSSLLFTSAVRAVLGCPSTKLGPVKFFFLLPLLSRQPAAMQCAALHCTTGRGGGKGGGGTVQSHCHLGVPPGVRQGRPVCGRDSEIPHVRARLRSTQKTSRHDCFGQREPDICLFWPLYRRFLPRPTDRR